MYRLLALLFLCAMPPLSRAAGIKLSPPARVPRFNPAEFVLRIDQPWYENPFTDVELTAVFRGEGRPEQTVRGFADTQDGRAFRLRYCPDQAGAYAWELSFRAADRTQRWSGTLQCDPADRAGPVIANPQRPRHFIHAGSRKPFYHLGYTAYHLLDPSNDDDQVQTLIDFCRREGFNKIRFLLTGYPRDSQAGTTAGDVEYGVADPWKAPNYGAKPGQVNPLPAWLGEPHRYDFTRFNVAHWQKADRAVHAMRAAGIVATCIFTIEKQRLPKEYGALSRAEYLLYQYAVARLAAFDNVWWDLGNEHNEFRDTRWGQAMGRFVKDQDPFDRLLSAHAYADFLYPRAAWADYIITQQYGDEKAVYDWVLKYRDVPQPYVNEEYGYEGRGERNQKGVPNAPGHGQDADWVRRCHWSIAMAGGYATYGDWSDGIAYFYMGEPGPGKGGRQLQHLRRFFEQLPFDALEPQPGAIMHEKISTTRGSVHGIEWRPGTTTSKKITTRDNVHPPEPPPAASTAPPPGVGGFCLARPPDCYVIYLPRGGQTRLSLPGAGRALAARWYNPRTGAWQPGPALPGAAAEITCPSADDWVLLVEGDN